MGQELKMLEKLDHIIILIQIRGHPILSLADIIILPSLMIVEDLIIFLGPVHLVEVDPLHTLREAHLLKVPQVVVDQPPQEEAVVPEDQGRIYDKKTFIFLNCIMQSWLVCPKHVRCTLTFWRK